MPNDDKPIAVPIIKFVAEYPGFKHIPAYETDLPLNSRYYGYLIAAATMASALFPGRDQFWDGVQIFLIAVGFWFVVKWLILFNGYLKNTYRFGDTRPWAWLSPFYTR